MNVNETNPLNTKLYWGQQIDRYWRHKESGVEMEISKQYLVDGLKRRVFYRNAVEVGILGNKAPTYAAWLVDFEKTHEPMGNSSDSF